MVLIHGEFGIFRRFGVIHFEACAISKTNSKLVLSPSIVLNGGQFTISDSFRFIPDDPEPLLQRKPVF
jgi:hypothetical protein